MFPLPPPKMKLRRIFSQSSPIFSFLCFKQYSLSVDWSLETPAAARVKVTQGHKPKPWDLLITSCLLTANPPPQEAKTEPSFPSPVSPKSKAFRKLRRDGFLIAVPAGKHLCLQGQGRYSWLLLMVLCDQLEGLQFLYFLILGITLNLTQFLH